MEIVRNQLVDFLARDGYRDTGRVLEIVRVALNGRTRGMLRIRSHRTGEVIVRDPRDDKAARQ